MSDFDWLQALASADECTVTEAAALLVQNGITLTAEDWRGLSTAGRAALTVARRAAAADELRAHGLDLAADVASAGFDGGRTAARSMARAAAQGVAAALQKKREASGG